MGFFGLGKKETLFGFAPKPQKQQNYAVNPDATTLPLQCSQDKVAEQNGEFFFGSQKPVDPDAATPSMPERQRENVRGSSFPPADNFPPRDGFP